MPKPLGKPSDSPEWLRFVVNLASVDTVKHASGRARQGAGTVVHMLASVRFEDCTSETGS